MKGLIAGDIIVSPYINAESISEDFVFLEPALKDNSRYDENGRMLSFNMTEVSPEPTVNSELALGVLAWLQRKEIVSCSLSDFISDNVIEKANPMVAAAILGAYGTNYRLPADPRQREAASTLSRRLEVVETLTSEYMSEVENLAMGKNYDMSGFHELCPLLSRVSLLSSMGRTMSEISAEVIPVLGTDFLIDTDKRFPKEGEQLSIDVTTRAALYSFFCSKDYESCIRTAALHGGDISAVAAISGALNEFKYGFTTKYGEAGKRNIDVRMMGSVEIMLMDFYGRHQLDKVQAFYESHEFGDSRIKTRDRLENLMNKGGTHPSNSLEYEKPLEGKIEYRQKAERPQINFQEEDKESFSCDVNVGANRIDRVSFHGKDFFFFDRSRMDIVKALKDSIHSQFADNAKEVTPSIFLASGTEKMPREEVVRIKISNSLPNGYRTDGILSDVAPSREIISKHIEKKMTDEQFKEAYRAQLESLDPKSIKSFIEACKEEGKDVVLVNGKYKTDFLQKNVLMSWLEENFGQGYAGEYGKKAAYRSEEYVISSEDIRFYDSSSKKHISELWDIQLAERKDTCVAPFTIDCATFYFDKGEIHGVSQTTCPEVANRYLRKHDGSFVMTEKRNEDGEKVMVKMENNLGIRQSNRDLFNQLVDIAKDVKSRMYEQLDIKSLAGVDFDVNFGSCIHIGDVTDNKICIMNGNLKEAEVYLDQETGQVRTNLLSEGKEHFQQNVLMGVKIWDSVEFKDALERAIFDEGVNISFSNGRAYVDHKEVGHVSKMITKNFGGKERHYFEKEMTRGNRMFVDRDDRFDTRGEAQRDAGIYEDEKVLSNRPNILKAEDDLAMTMDPVLNGDFKDFRNILVTKLQSMPNEDIRLEELLSDKAFSGYISDLKGRVDVSLVLRSMEEMRQRNFDFDSCYNYATGMELGEDVLDDYAFERERIICDVIERIGDMISYPGPSQSFNAFEEKLGDYETMEIDLFEHLSTPLVATQEREEMLKESKSLKVEESQDKTETAVNELGLC